nr:MAG TPA: hypothetical protein [Caudoviricetes sp.]
MDFYREEHMETFTQRLDAEEAAILQDHILGLLPKTKEMHLDLLANIDGGVPEVYDDYDDTMLTVMRREISRITDWLKNY